MAKAVEFDVSQASPTMDCHRREWAPRPGAGLAGTWIGAVVADPGGNDYWGLRGADDFFGPMTSSSSGKRPPRSWCWIEYTGDMMSSEILDLMMQQFRLARVR